MLLADLACEDEGFRSALPDYEAALDLLTHLQPVGRCSAATVQPLIKRHVLGFRFVGPPLRSLSAATD